MAVPLNLTIAGPDAAAFKRKIQAEALKRGLSVSEYVVDAIAEAMRRENGT